MELVPGRRRYALAFGHADALNPDDFLPVRDQRQAVTDLSRNMGVHQDVLYSLWLLEAQRAHPVARFAGGHRQRKPYEVRVEVTDRVASLEGRGIAGAGRGAHARRWQDSRLGLERCARCITAPERLHLREGRAGDERAMSSSGRARSPSRRRMAASPREPLPRSRWRRRVSTWSSRVWPSATAVLFVWATACRRKAYRAARAAFSVCGLSVAMRAVWK